MKKLITVALTCAMIFVLSSCRKPDKPLPEDTAEPVIAEKAVEEKKPEPKKQEARGPDKFIPTFLYYLGGGRTLVPGDEIILGKFDIVVLSRWRYDQIGGNAFEKIKAVNPDMDLYIYQQGVDTHLGRGDIPHDEYEAVGLNNISRFNNARGHSMGNLNKDNPELFLLDKNGKRCNTYMKGYGETRFLLDFGNEKFVKYWLEANEADIINRPWSTDGIYMDNTCPFQTFPSETPAKYDTREKWGEASNRYINGITKGLHERGQKCFINAGATGSKEAHKYFTDLDNSPYPPDVILEEGTFVTEWGSSDAQFYDEEKWRNSVDCLSLIRNSCQAYLTHTKIAPGETGIDNHGRPVTCMQAFWYALCSFLMGKDDDLNNAYFMFIGGGRVGTLQWFEEFEYIDLGKAQEKYKVTDCKGNNIYWREFEKGYVYVNPTSNDVTSIKLPQECKMITHANFKADPASIPDVAKIDLVSHHGILLVKTTDKNKFDPEKAEAESRKPVPVMFWDFNLGRGRMTIGKLSEEKAFSGKMSFKAAKIEGKSYHLEVRTNWNSAKKALCKLPDNDPHINFAYYATGGDDISVKAELPGEVTLRKDFRITPGKWVFVSLAVSDCGDAGKRAGGKLLTCLVFRLYDAAGEKFYIDDVSITEGPALPGAKKKVIGKTLSARKKGGRKFIKTFLYYLSGGPKLIPGDEIILAKFDMMLWNKYRNTQINGNTVKAIKDIDPTTETYIYTQGVDIWKSYDDRDVIYLNNNARYGNARGHSMGNLNDDNPDLFLLDKNGKRCNTYTKNYKKNRFLMDFGSEKYQKYFLEAVDLDVLQRPWKGDGMYLDNTCPIIAFPTETPVKYNTPEKWKDATIKYVNVLSRELAKKGQKLFINAGGTAADNSLEVFGELDNSEYPPAAVLEEGAFANSWGKPATKFYSERKWKNQVNCLGAIRNFIQAYLSHTNLEKGEHGIDNYGKPVTYWQSFYYCLASFLIGKNDIDDNSYFQFACNLGPGDWRRIAWQEEYEYIDLGRAKGTYKVSKVNGSNIYWREYEKGYAYANPTEKDILSIKLPQVCKELNHDNFRGALSSIPNIDTIDLKSHHGAILLKSEGKAVGKVSKTSKKTVKLDKEKIAELWNKTGIVQGVRLEAEDLTFNNARVEEFEQGGKGVLLNKQKSIIEAKVYLDKGIYDIMAQVFASDEKQGSFFISINGKGEKVFTREYGKISVSGKIRVRFSEAKEYKLTLFPSEKGIIIDAIVIQHPQYEGKPIVFEAESMILTNSVQANIKGGGKGVILTNTGSSLMGSVELSKGVYEIFVSVYASDGEHDGFKLQFNDTIKNLYPDEHKKTVKAQSMQVIIDRKKNCTFTISPRETGMIIDRMEIFRVKED